jgi:hypothetical protein
MKKIDFKKRSEQIEIAGKVYEIEVSNYDFIKKAQASLGALEDAQKRLNESGDVDALLDAMNSLFNLMLGDFERIWDEAGHDIYNMLDVAIALTEIVSDGFEYKRSKYI